METETKVRNDNYRKLILDIAFFLDAFTKVLLVSIECRTYLNIKGIGNVTGYQYMVMYKNKENGTLQAIIDGVDVQYFTTDIGWRTVDTGNITWQDIANGILRIKPEPKYRDYTPIEMMMKIDYQLHLKPESKLRKSSSYFIDSVGANFVIVKDTPHRGFRFSFKEMRENFYWLNECERGDVGEFGVLLNNE